jgi:replicative DNA helicase
MRGRGESQFVQLSRIANDLKQVAKQLDVHVLALAQIDRKIVEREDKRPRLSDLRGSGDLENAPDNVMFCYRPEYYLKRQQPPKDIEKRADWEAECADWAGKAEIIIEKARMGEITSVTVGCDMGTNRFWDLEPKEEYEF